MNERAHSSRFPVLPIRYFCLLSQFAPLLCEVQVQDFDRRVLDGGHRTGDMGLLKTFLTPTLVHFGVVFLIALLGL
jgi:hypothetical protein